MKSSWYEVIYPEGFSNECLAQLKLIWPLILMGLALNTTGTVAVAFCGHLGSVQLGAVSLAQSIITAFGFNIAVGFSSSSDTLFSQIFGGDNKKLMGVVLQRSLIIYTLVSMLCISVYINAEYLLIIIGVPQETAELTNDYLLIFLPGLLSYFWYMAFLKYIQNQDKIIGNMLIAIVAAFINILLHIIMAKIYRLDIIGSAISYCVTYICVLLMTIAYTFIGKMYEDTWDKCSSDAWQNWGQFYKLGVAGIFLSGFEWWMVEVGLIFSGTLGNTALGAFSILLQVEIPISNVFMAVGYAASIRVGHHLGGDRANHAMTAAAVAITMAVTGGFCFTILVISLKYYIPLIFTDQVEVLALSRHLFPALASFIFYEAVDTTVNGILRGCGLQYAGAMVSFVGLTLALAGIPVMYMAKITIEGYWILLSSCAIINAVGKTVIVSAIDWKTQVYQAFKRTRPVSAEVDDGQYKGKVYGDYEYYLYLKQQEIHDLLLGNREERLPRKQLICRRTTLILVYAAILATSIALKLTIYPESPVCTAAANCTLPDISNMSLPLHVV